MLLDAYVDLQDSEIKLQAAIRCEMECNLQASMRWQVWAVTGWIRPRPPRLSATITTRRAVWGSEEQSHAAACVHAARLTDGGTNTIDFTHLFPEAGEQGSRQLLILPPHQPAATPVLIMLHIKQARGDRGSGDTG